MAPRPDKYIGLDLTELNIWRLLLVYIWNYKAYQDDTNVSGYYECIGNDASDEAIGIGAKIEVDIRNWGT